MLSFDLYSEDKLEIESLTLKMNMPLTTLRREILRSDILRVNILMGFFLLFAAYAGVWAIFAPEDFNIIFKNQVRFWSPSLFLFAIALYYMVQGLVLYSYKRREIPIPAWLQFLTLFLETSIPTLLLYIIGQFHPPAYTLLSSRILLYFISTATTLIRLYRDLIIFGIIHLSHAHIISVNMYHLT